ncbi:hypothetical protein VSDG_08030 [Cytospora chrysosperma]|uniref:GRF-type domain-containing protein n=1 Tax=Cytospora chrysosperma TaxID=252740 RepID=A0A423VIQ2_CYTCH|nr:hypothetical protein VSDG_08030 [Valsa sordida]
MFKTPSKPGTTPSKPYSASKKKGLLEDGQWLCDCTPRQPAICLTVKKETKNKGKRFYLCQERNCEMFLWEDQAKARERDALLLHNCRSENGVTGTIRPKTPEPAPPLNLKPNPNPSAARTFAPGPRLTDAKITSYTARQPRPQQRVFRGLDDPREGYLPDLTSDSDEDAPDKAPQQQQQEPSQAQNRQRSYLSQPAPPGEISQTLRDDSSYRPPSSGVAGAADAGAGPAFRHQAFHHPSGLVNPVTPTAKRKRSVFPEEEGEKEEGGREGGGGGGGGDDDSDDFGGDDLAGSETERQLAQITDESARKQQRTWDVYGTPSARRAAGADEGIRNDLGLPTPRSRRPGLLVAPEERGRAATRQRHVCFTSPGGDDDDDDEVRFQPEAVGDPATPTPYRKTDALAPTTPTAPAAAAATTTTDNSRSPAAAAAAVDDYPRIAEEVLSLLSGQPVSESTKRTLWAAMERHEMRVKGVARGREAARAGIAERDERIAELQARVVSLENGRKMDRARLRELGALGERLMRLSEGDEEEEK